MKIKVAQIVGLNTDQKAALTAYQQREDETFLALLQLTCDDAFTKGRLILSDLEEIYFDFESDAAGEKLNATFSNALEKLSKEGEFDLLLASMSGKALYLIGQGDLEAYLKRQGKLSPLLSIGNPAQIISGFLQPGDRIFLSTKSLITFLGDDLLRSLSLPIDTLEEEVSSNIAAEGLAGLVVEIEADSEEIIPALSQDEEITEAIKKKNSIVILLHSLRAFIRNLSTSFPKSGRGRLVLAIVLVFIIAVGAWLQYKNSKDKEKMLQFNQNLQAAKDEFAAARGLSSLNPAEAKGKLTAAKDKVDFALSLYSNSQQAQGLKKNIENESSSILQQFEASEFPLFLDLDLIKKGFKAQNLTLSAGEVLLLDQDSKTLVSINLTKKSHQILSGKDKLGMAKYASINGSLAFVYSEDKGIVRVDTEDQKDTQVAKKDSDWGQIKDIAGFAGNVYLLDTAQVWKYLPTSSGYSSKREYLTKNTKADFTNAQRMQIESSIYVLKTGGEILRFTKGAADHFSLGGLDKGVKDPKSIFVSSDTDNLYVLDSGNSRLLILTKTGEYKGQITGSKFGSASDLVVDEKGKKVYLLEGSKIYTVDLK